MSLEGVPSRCALSTMHGIVIPRAHGIHEAQMSWRESEFIDSGRPNTRRLLRVIP